MRKRRVIFFLLYRFISLVTTSALFIAMTPTAHVAAPDLTPTALAVAGMPVRGNRPVDVSWTVQNRGDGEAGPGGRMPCISRPMRCGIRKTHT